jgi:hypothetical protein
VPPPDPLTNLRLLAGDIARFADAVEHETELDARVFRYWHARLLEIAADLDGSRPQPPRS